MLPDARSERLRYANHEAAVARGGELTFSVKAGRLKEMNMKRNYAALILVVSMFSSVCAHAASAGDAKAGKKMAEQMCVACHGPKKTLNNDTPILSGQTWQYLYFQMRDFKSGRRTNEFMTPIMKQMSKEDMYNLAAFYTESKYQSDNEKGDPTLIDKGRKVADNALCTMCHLGSFKGQNEVPRVAGQNYSYIVKQLLAFKNKDRTNDAGTMTAYTASMTKDQIDAVAAYVAGLQIQ
jgi:cytochrome c553